jgi:hypothetical protein
MLVEEYHGKQEEVLVKSRAQTPIQKLSNLERD